MKRRTLQLLLSLAAVGLMIPVAQPAAAQTVAQKTQTTQMRKINRRNMPTNRLRPGETESMQDMMKQTHALMGEISKMMGEHHGTTQQGPHEMTLRSMHSLGSSMEQMMNQMNEVLSNETLMKNPQLSLDMRAMRTEMRTMVNSLQGMVDSMHSGQSR